MKRSKAGSKLVVGRIDQRGGHIGMVAQRVVVGRDRHRPEVLRELARRLRSKARRHHLDRGLGIPHACAVRPSRREREALRVGGSRAPSGGSVPPMRGQRYTSSDTGLTAASNVPQSELFE